MISFKAFLQEGKAGPTKAGDTRSSPISYDKALKLAHERCRIALSFDEPAIIRGNQSRADYAFATPSLHSRVSENTSNETTLIIDNSAKWNNFPKRSESLICTTGIGGYDYADEYGTVKIILPVDKGPHGFGIASKQDFWYSFPRLESEFGKGWMVDDFNNILRNLMDSDNQNETVSAGNTDWSKLKQVLDKMGNYLNDAETSKVLKNTYPSFMNGKFKSFSEYCDWLLEPAANDFKCVTYEELYKHRREDREIWTDRDCLIIAANHEPSKSGVISAFNAFREEVFDAHGDF